MMHRLAINGLVYFRQCDADEHGKPKADAFVCFDYAEPEINIYTTHGAAAPSEGGVYSTFGGVKLKLNYTYDNHECNVCVVQPDADTAELRLLGYSLTGHSVNDNKRHPSPLHDGDGDAMRLSAALSKEPPPPKAHEKMGWPIPSRKQQWRHR